MNPKQGQCQRSDIHPCGQGRRATKIFNIGDKCIMMIIFWIIIADNFWNVSLSVLALLFNAKYGQYFHQ